MAIEVRIPGRVASKVASTNAGRGPQVDDAPTAESPVPCFEEEDDLLLDVDDPDTRDTVMLDLSRVIENEAVAAVAKERSSVLQRIRGSARLQLVLMSAAGVLISGWLFSGG